jgi:hypothetical protein
MAAGTVINPLSFTATLRVQMNFTVSGSAALALLLFATSLAASGADLCNLSAPNAAASGRNCARQWMDQNLKLNDLLTVGTHNSYKTTIPSSVMKVIGEISPHSAQGLDYGHRPLDAQLDAGARQLEIDVYYDPQGGRFAHPVFPAMAHVSIEPWRLQAWSKPGFKVMHVPDMDVLSSCPTLVGCLQVIRTWSLKHPDHAPIMLMFNAKDDQSSAPGGTGALPFTEIAFDALDAEIRSVFPAQALITPDDVQHGFPTLREAVLHDNWPTLGQARGKVLFALDEGPQKVALYRGKRTSLEGRVFFINTDEDSPAAAYLTLNEVPTDAARIARDVQAGFIIRTRADANTLEARKNDVGRRDVALTSGAQYVSTDYLWPDPRFPGEYRVRLPNGAAVICNPVRAAGKCGGLPVETAGSH